MDIELVRFALQASEIPQELLEKGWPRHQLKILNPVGMNI
jgi:hypothetical protein